jgi:pSer/pThr/pTyr-binding forkhead associated (FHA) protein
MVSHANGHAVIDLRQGDPAPVEAEWAAFMPPPAVAPPEPTTPVPLVPPSPSRRVGAADEPSDDQTIGIMMLRFTGPAQLRIDDGTVVDIDGVVLIGRAPRPSGNDADVRLITIDDPHRTVSKSHLAIGVTDGVVWVEDRHSTNGTAVRTPGATTLTPLAPGVRVPLAAAAVIHFGRHTAQVVS